MKDKAGSKNDRHLHSKTQVRMPDELKDRLKAVSEKHSIPMNSIMVSGIEKRVEELAKKDPV